MDGRMLDRVAEEHRAGCRLNVGATDLTHGRSITWDMGAVAASSAADRRERYAAVLLAAAAVTGVIEPVVVGAPSQPTSLHGDGATKALILFDEAMLAHCSRPSRVGRW